MTPSQAQHALGLTSLLLSPLLQATSPTIASPLLSESGPAEVNTSSALKESINNRSPATSGAAYARSTLGVLTVSQSKAMAAVNVPSWACAWLCCTLEGGHVPKHRHCCLAPWGQGASVSHATWSILCVTHSLSVKWPA